MHFKIKGFSSYWRSAKRLHLSEIIIRDDQDSEESLDMDDAIKIDSEMLASTNRLYHIAFALSYPEFYCCSSSTIEKCDDTLRVCLTTKVPHQARSKCSGKQRTTGVTDGDASNC